MIRVQFDTVMLARRMQQHVDQIPYATRIAVNETAKKIQTALKIEARAAFDRPTGFTLNAPMVKFARRGEITAEVFLRNEASKGTPPVKYLEPEVQGGGRRVKRFERALQLRGILGPNEFAMPGQDARLNAYGNIGAGQIVQILSQLKAFSEVGFTANETARSAARAGGNRSRYFATRAGQSLRPGVYERTGPTTSTRQRALAKKATREARAAGFGVTVKANRIVPRGVRPVLIFTGAPRYRARYRFVDVARQTQARVWSGEFKRALRTAIRTAR